MRVRLQHLARNPAFFSFSFFNLGKRLRLRLLPSLISLFLSSLSLVFVGLLEEIGVGLSDLVYLLMVLMVLVSCKFELFEVAVGCGSGGRFASVKVVDYRWVCL